MILKTHNTASGLAIEHSSDSPLQPAPSSSPANAAVDLVGHLAARYDIPALSSLLASTRTALNQDEITAAVLGRFKAGKSSFLNDLIGRDILPVGVAVRQEFEREFPT